MLQRYQNSSETERAKNTNLLFSVVETWCPFPECVARNVLPIQSTVSHPVPVKNTSTRNSVLTLLETVLERNTDKTC